MTYKVGRGKPPKKTRFKTGRSGNPNGRPRKDKSFEALIEAELASSILVQEGGKTRKITKKAAIAKRLVQDSMNKGASKSTSMVLTSDKNASDTDMRGLTPTTEFDLEVIRRFAPQFLIKGEK